MTSMDVMHLVYNAVDRNNPLIDTPIIWERYMIDNIPYEENERDVAMRYQNRVMHHHMYTSSQICNEIVCISNTTHIYMPFMHWIATGGWYLVSVFDVVDDRNGFYTLKYETGREYGFVQMFIGTIRNFPANVGGIAADCSISTNNQKTNLILFITYINRVFADTAYGLYDALTKIGFTSEQVYIMGDFNTTMYLELHERMSQITRHSCEYGILLQIAIGPHEPQMLSPFYISFQMEQPWTIFGGQSYAVTLKGAIAVWVLSDAHGCTFSENYNISGDRFAVVPLFTRPVQYDSSYVQQLVSDGNFEVFDMSFLGSCSERRQVILRTLHRRATDDNITFNYRCIGSWKDVYLAEERDIFVLQTKVLLNIHHSDTSSMEVHRILYMLSKGVCVVSERSKVDPQLDAEYEESGAVIFVDSIDDMFLVAIDLARNETKRKLQQDLALKKYHEVESRLDVLQNAIVHSINSIKDRFL
jgi:hypothetical protein